MLATVVGFAFALAGIWGMIHWRQDFLSVALGLFPLLFFFGGLVAGLVGLMSVRPSSEVERRSADGRSAEKSSPRASS